MRWLIVCTVAMAILGCAPGVSGPATGAPAGSTAPSPARTQGKTLIVATRLEPTSLAALPLQRTGVTLNFTLGLFNAGLAVMDARGQAIPYLAESLPTLNTDSWKVFDDGTMETTYKLRPNLTWHDGQPLTADDFVFAWQVYTNPAFGLANAAPQGLMTDVAAPDPQTLVFHWKQPYPFAGELESVTMRSNFPPLPRHLLGTQLEQLDPQAFLALPFWTTAYVGAGAYRVDSWQPGSSLQATAFDGYALGRPKIDHMELHFINDANTALSNLLSGAVQLTADDAIYFQQATVLKQQWTSPSMGSIVVTPGLWRYEEFQLSPEYNRASALMDLRVRKALAFTIDRNAINEGVYEGQGIIADSMVPPTEDFYSVVENAVTKYPFDPRQSEQLMNDAGFTKGADGIYSSPSSGRLSLDLKVTQSPQNETEQSIMGDTWRNQGFDISESVLPAAQAQDGQARATFPAMWTNSTVAGISMIAVRGTPNIPNAENHWNGGDRGHWSNPEYDRLAAAYNTTLDRDQRIQEIAQMAAVISEDLPTVSINFNPGITAFTGVLTGPATVSPDGNVAWNVHDWQLQ